MKKVPFRVLTERYKNMYLLTEWEGQPKRSQ